MEGMVVIVVLVVLVVLRVMEVVVMVVMVIVITFVEVMVIGGDRGVGSDSRGGSFVGDGDGSGGSDGVCSSRMECIGEFFFFKV